MDHIPRDFSSWRKFPQNQFVAGGESLSIFYQKLLESVLGLQNVLLQKPDISMAISEIGCPLHNWKLKDRNIKLTLRGHGDWGVQLQNLHQEFSPSLSSITMISAWCVYELNTNNLVELIFGNSCMKYSETSYFNRFLAITQK